MKVQTELLKFRASSWRGTTQYKLATDEIGLSFDVEGGEILRVKLKAACARHLLASLNEFLPDLGPLGQVTGGIDEKLSIPGAVTCGAVEDVICGRHRGRVVAEAVVVDEQAETASTRLDPKGSIRCTVVPHINELL